MAKVRNRNARRDLFRPMEATHTSQYIEKMYDSNEQKTVQTLTDESIVLSGYMVYYVFRTEIDIDEILFEPNTSKFDEAFQIAATFPEHVMSWDNGDALMAKFGLQQDAEGEFVVSQRAWDIIMGDRKADKLYTYHRPREGDLIVMPNAQRHEKSDDPNLKNQQNNVFQITYVNKGKNNWQWGKDYVWRISATAYKYDANEHLDAKDDNDNPLFNIDDDFKLPDQNDPFTDEEKDIKVWDEEHPFGGY